MVRSRGVPAVSQINGLRQGAGDLGPLIDKDYFCFFPYPGTGRERVQLVVSLASLEGSHPPA